MITTYTTFSEYYEDYKKRNLEEHSIARKGDWEFDISHIGTLSSYMYKRYWEVKGHMNIDESRFEIIKHTKSNTWAVGRLISTEDGEEIFDRVLFLEMENAKNIGYKVQISNLYRAKMVGVKENLRGYSIAKNIYKFLVKTQGYNIIGDVEQFFGARKLWKSLSNDTDVVVDIIDINAQDYIERNVTLHHGTDDWDFDKRIWDYEDSLKHIRLVLKDIL